MSQKEVAPPDGRRCAACRKRLFDRLRDFLNLQKGSKSQLIKRERKP